MFRDRADAAQQLAERLKNLPLENPLVLGIPRGGMVVAAVLARELGGELDVVLARKLRAPFQPELAIGAVGEDGEIFLTDFAAGVPGVNDRYVHEECNHQSAEIARRRALFRAVKPPAAVTGRSVIVTDDGIATGATLRAALQLLRRKKPRELIMAVPVAPPEALARFAPLADRVEILRTPEYFSAVGASYADFRPVDDEEVVQLLREAVARERAAGGGAAPA